MRRTVSNSHDLLEILKNPRVKNFFIYGFGQAVNIISPLIILPYLVEVCTLSGVGKISVGFSFALILNVIVDYGSYINGTKEVSINRENFEILSEKILAIYLMKFFLVVLIGISCFVLIETIPYFKVESSLFYYSLPYVLGQFLNPTWFFQGMEKYKWISFINILSKVIYVVLVFLFIKNEQDYVFANAYLGLGLIISSLTGVVYLAKTYKLRWYAGTFDSAVRLLRIEFSLTVSQLFLSFYQYIPVMMVGALLGYGFAGKYRIIEQVTSTFRTYLQMFFNFIYADVCLKIFQDAAKGVRLWLRYNLANGFFVIFLGVIVLFFSNYILLFFKTATSELPQMNSLLKIGMLIPVFTLVSLALKQLLFSLDKNKEYIRITVATTLLSLLVFYGMVKEFHIAGAFITTLIIEILVIVSYFSVLKRAEIFKHLYGRNNPQG